MTATLTKANTYRIARAAKLRDIRSGEVDPVGAILTSNEGMTVMEMLKAVPRFGRQKSALLMDRLMICEDRVFGEPTPTQAAKGARPISQRQRVILADEIEDFMQRTGRRAA